MSTTTSRSPIIIIVATLACLVLAGCNACDTQNAGISPVRAVAAAAPACAPCAAAAAPATGLTLLAPTGTYAVEPPVGVRYTVGANEWGRAAFAIPANVVACWTDGAAKGLVLLGDTLRCTANNLWPNPQPTATLVYRAPAAAYAAPCAPPAAATAPTCQP